MKLLGTLVMLGLLPVAGTIAGEQCFTLKTQNSNLPLLIGVLNSKSAEFKVVAKEKWFTGLVGSDGKVIMADNIDANGKAIRVEVVVRVKDLIQGAAEDKAYKLLKSLSTFNNTSAYKIYGSEVLGSWGRGKESCESFDGLVSDI